MKKEKDIVNIPTHVKDVRFVQSGELFNKELLETNLNEHEMRTYFKVLLLSLIMLGMSVL